MSADLRRRQIQAQLAEKGEVAIADLTAEFGTSAMTIRRDLEFLELDGSARRVRGGAISPIGRSHEPAYQVRAGSESTAKRAIGRAAADLLRDGETAILDTGTTTLELARNLPRDIRMTVVTASLPIAAEAAARPDVRVIVTGGVLRQGELSLVGAAAEQTFEPLNCDTVFLGIGGLDAQHGLTEYNLDDARVKVAALKSARRCIVLADSSKLGRVSFAQIAPASAIDVLVTDARPDHPVVQELEQAGVEVIHVEVTKE